MIGGMAVAGSSTQHVTSPAWTIIPLLSWVLATSGQDDAHGDPGASKTPSLFGQTKLSNICVCSAVLFALAAASLCLTTTLPRFVTGVGVYLLLVS